MEFLKKTELLVGQQAIEKLKNSKVIILGIGGVGGYVLEMLVRSGVGEIDVVDFDVIDVTNINRQILATHDNIGELKTQVAMNRAKSINPDIKVNAINIKVNKDNIPEILNKFYDFVIDCIDKTITDKVELIDYCYKNNLRIISSMGTGNRYGMPAYHINDLYETQNDKLSKVLRKYCRRRKIAHSLVCHTTEQPSRYEKPIANIAYHPATSGITIASYVINELIKS